MEFLEIVEFLNEKVVLYNQPQFIESDPISIPHAFTQKEDVEISGFLAATLAWGNRKAIIKSANYLMTLLDHQPYEFVMHAAESDLKRFEKFVYRTFNGEDALFFVKALQHIYRKHHGLESVFTKGFDGDLKSALIYFRSLFMGDHTVRTSKHMANVLKGSSAKRLNMFLRWMIRNDNCGVDFGIWKSLSSADLYLPLDVHTGNVSRKLGLLNRKQSDWKAVEEVTNQLRKMDATDPVKYDFALFGLGIFEKF